jgi:hypothetical protein
MDLNKTYARHFGTAKQLAQEASEGSGDLARVARALRELSEGLLWLAGDVIYVRQQALAKAAPSTPARPSAKPPTM